MEDESDAVTGGLMMNGWSAPTETEDPFLPGASEVALALHDAPWTRFAAVGDSGAAGVTEAFAGYATRSWFDRVAESLRAEQPALTVLNLGTPDVLASQVKQEQLARALKFAPDLVAVLSGGNDILKRHFAAEATGADIGAVVAALKAAGSTVVLTGLFDITNSPYVADKYRPVMSERITLLSRVIADVARVNDALYVDLPSHPAGSATIYSSDGLHLNARGQAILAAEVIRCLGRHLACRTASEQ